MQKEVEYLLWNGLAVPNTNSWSSSYLLVPKPDLTTWFCTDYRKINNVTQPGSFPLPRIEGCIDKEGSACYINKLDLFKGYWQVPLMQRASGIMTFVPPDNFLQYSVMSFSICNAPVTFQHLMWTVLSGVAVCEGYLDNTVLGVLHWHAHGYVLVF